MKARVEVVIREEMGKIISQLTPKPIDLGTQSLHDIEGAVEIWKQQALPEIEAESSSHHFWSRSHHHSRLVSPWQETPRADVNDCHQ